MELVFLFFPRPTQDARKQWKTAFDILLKMIFNKQVYTQLSPIKHEDGMKTFSGMQGLRALTSNASFKIFFLVVK